jgi:hypothetical protein
LGLGFGLTLAGLFGTYQQITILNPQTILVYPQDIQAIHWLDEHLPPEAHIAVNSWLWLGNTWAGSDGGAWIVPLTGRSTSTPPADYIYNRDLLARVNGFNEALRALKNGMPQKRPNFCVTGVLPTSSSALAAASLIRPRCCKTLS